MAIDSVLNPVGMAQKLSVPQLQKAIQDGTIPPYVGIPVLQQKIAIEQRMRNATAQPQQGPSIAQKVMSEAQGLDGLQSNLPSEFANGGIVAFAGGDLVKSLLEDDEDVDQDYIDSITSAMEKMDAMREMMSSLRPESKGLSGELETLPVGTTGDGITKTEVSKGISVKEGNKPAKTVEKRAKSVSAPAGLDDLLALVQQKESGGRQYDRYGNLLTSPKGAESSMQVMPGTQLDPGFGVTPARSRSAEEIDRVGRDYFKAMLDRYGDPKVAAIAYNWGPGNTDKWLMAGADPSRLPGETRQYAQGFAGGGVAHFDGGGIADLFSMAPEEVKDYARRMLRMGDARAAFSAAPAAPAPSAAAAAPATATQESLLTRGIAGLRQLPYEAGKFLGQAVKSPLTRGVGLAALLTPSSTNEGEMEELARRQKMAPTIDTTDRLTPMAPPAGARPAVAAGAGAGRGGMGGPTAADLRRAEFEKQIGETQDTEDLMAGLYAPEPEAKEPQKTEEAKAPDAMQSLRDRITKGYESLQKQQESDKYLSLLAAGLGMMGGTSPYAAANIGAGGLKGIQALQQAEASRAAQEKALMGAELGVERYGQLGALQREQMAMRQQLAEAERQRKIEAAQAATEGKAASLLERQRKTDEDMLTRLEAQADKMVESSGKLASLEALGKSSDEIARAKQKMKDDLLAQNKRYQAIYGRLYPGERESFGAMKIREYDPKTGTLK